ncbi:universal stress protein [Haloarchaeobius sp. HRN-SO-5]|uniref:universal stress protein n=1 Tax=Haloarchaeobius sp. HRN-SO-5 TaxID=3446118 RepID=UPI003EBC146E
MYDVVLFPINASEGTERAREHALELAADQGATLHVLHVVEVASPGASLHDMLAEKLTERGRELVDAVADAARERGIAVETHIREGDPAQTIVEYAAEEGVDVIVMPTHGRPELTKAIVGSVTDKVIRTGDVPVVVVKVED